MSECADPASVTVQCRQIARLPLARSKIFFGQTDPTPMDIGFFVWLIRTPQRTILVDTGLPIDSVERDCLIRVNASSDPGELFCDLVSLADVLADWRVSPDQIDAVLVTQAVTYHTGGLSQWLLPRAQVFLAHAAIDDFLTGKTGHPRTDLFFTTEGWSVLRELAVADRLQLVTDRAVVDPYVSFIVTGGHHPGSAAVSIEADRSLCLLETAFVKENISDLVPVGICENVGLARSAMRHALASHDEVVAIHDLANATRFAAP